MFYQIQTTTRETGQLFSDTSPYEVNEPSIIIYSEDLLVFKITFPYNIKLGHSTKSIERLRLQLFVERRAICQAIKSSFKITLCTFQQSMWLISKSSKNNSFDCENINMENKIPDFSSDRASHRQSCPIPYAWPPSWRPKQPRPREWSVESRPKFLSGQIRDAENKNVQF